MRTLIVVSGGDAPGINTVIARFVRLAEVSGDDVMGATDSLPGVLNDAIAPLTSVQTNPLMWLSGSVLASSRDPVLADPENQRRFAEKLAQHDIDNVLLFGGDGSLRHIPPVFQALDIPFVALPTTIDNDLMLTERSLGFDSACNFARSAIDGITATGAAMPGRIFVVETLGGDNGILALAVAHAADAQAVLIPEIDYDIDWLAERTLAAVARQRMALLIVSEGAADARALPERLASATGVRIRDVRLGHAQRGAPVSHLDRTLAAEMAALSYNTLRENDQCAGVVVVANGEIQLAPYSDLPHARRQPDGDLYARINGLAT